jgi:hypothetical protein
MEHFLRLILDPLKEVYGRFREFAPNLLAAMTIILAGILLARLVKWTVLRFLKVVKFDSWSDRMGLTAVMRKGDLWARPSDALGSFVFWLLTIMFLMAGLSALNIPAIETLVAHFFLYLPRAFSTLLILVFGYIIAGFIGRAVLIAAVNSGYHYAKLLAEAVRVLLTVLILAMALEQLQVAPSIVVAAFSITFGGIVIALAISFGVGGIEAARRMIEKEQEKQTEPKDIEHL